jgi:YD repeat-containing protein
MGVYAASPNINPDPVNIPYTPDPVFALSSPQMTEIQRFGEYPVSLNAGLVDISIPLWEVKSGSLSMPISMSFHASGRRADAKPGKLGFGWVLNAGGLITRKVKDFPDEETSLSQYIDKDKITDYALYGEVKNKKIDLERDLFTYSGPVGTGKFVIDGDDEEDEVLIPIPHTSSQIKKYRYVSSQGEEDYFYFEIIDADGNIYIYGRGLDGEPQEEMITNNNYHPNRKYLYVPTAWMLTAIISSSKKDTIEFIYEKERKVVNRTYINDHLIAFSNFTDNLKKYSVEYFPIKTSKPEVKRESVVSSYKVPQLNKIIFKNGYVEFISDGDLISSINVKDKEGNIIRKFGMEYSIVKNDIHHSINKMTIYNGRENVEEVYKFDYYNPKLWNVENERSQDFWGYFNAKGNIDMIPYAKDIPYFTSSANHEYLNFGDISERFKRETNGEAMLLGMIKSITYPTGGKTEFFYEPNVYNNKIVGGLRIRQIKNSSNRGVDEYKTYEYYNGQMPSMLCPDIIQHYMKHEDEICYLYNDDIYSRIMATRTRYTCNVPSHFYDFVSQLVYYGMVVEYRGTKERNIGWTEYFYDDAHFSFPTLKQDLSNSYSIKTIDYSSCWNKPNLNYVYEYDVDSNLIKLTEMLYGSIKSNTTSPLKNISYAQYVNMVPGCIIKSVLNTSTDYDDDEEEQKQKFDMECTTLHEYSDDITKFWMQGGDRDNVYSYHMLQKNYGIYPMFNYSNYVIGTGAKVFMGKTEYICPTNVKCSEYGYSERKSKMFSTNIKYEYNQETLLPTSKEVTNSDGLVYKTSYKYPFNFKDKSPYQQMVGRNIQRPIVEEELFVDNVFMGRKTNTYAQHSNNWNLYVLKKTSTQKTENAVEDICKHYDKYDERGNLLQATEVGGGTTTYLWGYNHTYPIAEITDATYDQVIGILTSDVVKRLAESDEPSSADLVSLNNLRDRLTRAHITTYTYEKFKGMKSTTDPRGITTYYEYDDFGRLIAVKDLHGNIIKSHEYNYKNK